MEFAPIIVLKKQYPTICPNFLQFYFTYMPIIEFDCVKLSPKQWNTFDNLLGYLWIIHTREFIYLI